MCMLRLYRRQKEYGFDLRGPGWHGESCRQILHLGVPSSLQNGMIALSNVAVQSGINLFGTKAIAGCGVWSKLEGFGLLPILSFTMALSTFTGQNKGAQNPERIRKGNGIRDLLLRGHISGDQCYPVYLCSIFCEDFQPGSGGGGIWDSESAYIHAVFYSREQRAKRTCLHVHLATAARVKYPAALLRGI